MPRSVQRSASRGRPRRFGTLQIILACAMSLLAGVKIGQLRFVSDESSPRTQELRPQRLMESQWHSLEELGEAVRSLRGRVGEIADRGDADAAWREVAELTEWLEDRPTERRETRTRAVDVKTKVDAALPAPAKVPREVPQMKELDSTTALVVICFDRADLLRKCLEAVVRRAPCAMRLLVSQDGGGKREAKVGREAEAAFENLRSRCPRSRCRRVVHEQQLQSGSGYHKLARHFKFALSSAFDLEGVDRVIVLEEDLIVSPDFFNFFAFVAPVLDTDKTLLAASAFNDNGQRGNVRDASAVLRSDFFPGLGWMLTQNIWAELGPKWPDAYWDDWLREPDQRKGRHILRPEISRSYHLASSGGTSHGQFADYLKNIQLYDGPEETDFGDPQNLDMHIYDRHFIDDLRAALKLEKPSDITHAPPGPLRLEYDGIDDRLGPNAFPALARALGIMDNVKAGVPRTAYRGVVSFYREDHLIYLAPPLAEVERRLFTTAS